VFCTTGNKQELAAVCQTAIKQNAAILAFEL